MDDVLTSHEVHVMITKMKQMNITLITMDINVLLLVLIQMSDLTQEKCKEIINLYEPTNEARINGQLLIDGKYTTLYSCMLLIQIQILHDASH
jgi:hypothetical protein